MNSFVTTLLLLISLSAQAQFTDSFADGDFVNNPGWNGDTGHFEVDNNLELHLDAPSQTASSHLSTPSQAIGGASWIFSVRLEFNPSGSNHLDVHLTSSAPNPDTAARSYFVRIGDTDDEIALFRKANGNSSKIIDGTDGRVDEDPVEVRIKVERDSTGSFSLFSDTSGSGGSFILEGSGYDDLVQTSSFFAFRCTYTSTRSDKFYFDDIAVNGAPYQDSIAPSLDSLGSAGPGRIELYYDEALDPNSFDEGSFDLRPSIGAPDSLELFASQQGIHLYYPTGIPNDSSYELRIAPLSDTAGNSSDSLERSFLYRIPHPPEKGGVVINEVMADPNPPVSLPPREFLELHAADTLIQDLEAWSLLIGSDSIELPARTLSAGERVLVHEEADSSLFQDSSAILLENLPALTNGGEWVALIDPNGNLIDSVHYRDDWYGDSEKAEGGWSLERIDPTSPCRKGSNWSASIDPSGGTPGRKNSVHDPEHDRSPPTPLNARTTSADTVELRSDEALSKTTSFKEKLNIPDGPSIDTVLLKGEGKVVRIGLEEALDTGEWRVIETDPLPDCFGNMAAEGHSLEFVLPYSARKKDVVINEVLFDPFPGGVDFVEIFNRSERILDLSGWELARYKDSIEGHEMIDARELLLSADEHLYLSSEPRTVKANFPNSILENGYEMGGFPTYPNDSGTVILLRKGDKVMDRFSYRSAMHHSLIPEPEGVSLERIDPKGPTQDSNNWHSAAASEGHATPGYRNSQYMGKEKASKERLWTESRIFSPDMDGKSDLLRIHYRFSQQGMNCSLCIHDPRGRRISELADGETFGKKGSYTWDGTMTDGSKAPIGIYVIVLECVHPEGKQLIEKESCVLGTRW